MNRVTETMTRLTVGPWMVRVWRQTPRMELGPDQEVQQVLWNLINPAPADIADALDQLSGMNAYEILNADGNGALVYPNWP